MHRYLSIILGSLCMGLSLEVCYIPHRFLDGGMVGVAVLLGRWAGIAPAHLLFALNGATLLVGVTRLGREFMLRAAASFLTLGLFLWLVGPIPAVLPPWPAAVLGGAVLGFGLTLVLRSGGALDGSEVLGLVLERIYGLPIIWFLLVSNGFIFGLVAYRYGLTTASHSILAQAVVQVVLMVGLRARRSQ